MSDPQSTVDDFFNDYTPAPVAAPVVVPDPQSATQPQAVSDFFADYAPPSETKGTVNNGEAASQPATSDGVGAVSPDGAKKVDDQGQETFPQKMYDVFADKPGITYASMIPMSTELDANGNHIPGSNRPAFPEMIRSPLRGLAELMAGTSGELAPSDTLSPDALGALTLASPASVASGGLSAVGQAVGAAGKALDFVAKPTVYGDLEDAAVDRLFSQPIKDYPANAEEGAVRTSALYDQVKQQGANVIPADAVQAAMDKSFALRPQDPVAQAALGNSVLTDTLDKLQSGLATGPLTLHGASEIDRGLGQQINQLYKTGDNANASALSQVQDNLRDAIGSGPLTPALQSATQTFKMRDIENAIYRANLTGNPDTSLQNSFKSILNNKSKSASYNDDEKSIMESATKPGIINTTLNTASKILPIIGAAAGGGMAGGEGAVIGDLVGSGAQTAVKGMIGGAQMGKARKLMDVIGKGYPDAPAPQQAEAAPAASAPLLALPKPSINVPPGGFGPQSPLGNVPPAGPVAQPTSAGLRALPDYSPPGQRPLLSYTPRPDFIGSPGGAVDATPNAQVGPYQFGAGSGMPLTPGEIKAAQENMRRINNDRLGPVGTQRSLF